MSSSVPAKGSLPPRPSTPPEQPGHLTFHHMARTKASQCWYQLESLDSSGVTPSSGLRLPPLQDPPQAQTSWYGHPSSQYPPPDTSPGQSRQSKQSTNNRMAIDTLLSDESPPARTTHQTNKMRASAASSPSFPFDSPRPHGGHQTLDPPTKAFAVSCLVDSASEDRMPWRPSFQLPPLTSHSRHLHDFDADHSLHSRGSSVAHSFDQPVFESSPITLSPTTSVADSRCEYSPYPTAQTPGLAATVSPTPPLNYKLVIRQQPVAARACGQGERDRRVIDPPPIIELKVTHKDNNAPARDTTGLLALHCTLHDPDTGVDVTTISAGQADPRSARRLMGTLVTSAYEAKDADGIPGLFFTFPDLSCRYPDRYRLHFKLLRIDPMNMQQGAIHPTVTSIVTDIFTVYTAKDFPGMRASSALLKALRKQGLNVGIKKGSEVRRSKGRVRRNSTSESSDRSSGEDEDDGEDARQRSTTTRDSGSRPGEERPNATPRKRVGGKRRRRESG